ncbi:hypothetical protein HPB50_000395 [Hyalomma asiaticum]|uniref:Uncharacterized protein n=1 Tax=Hyalomma asiaticum TaxID=266040 RepID=A0ACB7SCI5_HYAAI|nr:hypothetical protein HPB50_000395 [Hyalomma asiaticum]
MASNDPTKPRLKLRAAEEYSPSWARSARLGLAFLLFRESIVIGTPLWPPKTAEQKIIYTSPRAINPERCTRHPAKWLGLYGFESSGTVVIGTCRVLRTTLPLFEQTLMSAPTLPQRRDASACALRSSSTGTHGWSLARPANRHTTGFARKYRRHAHPLVVILYSAARREPTFRRRGPRSVVAISEVLPSYARVTAL